MYPGRTMRRHIRLLCVVSAILGGAACDERLSDIAGPTPNLEPTFAAIQRDVFEAADSAGRRACIACHTDVGRTPAAGLNLTHDVAYSQIVNVVSARKAAAVRIVPGNPDGSYLVQKIEGRSDIVGVRMPINGPYLTDGQVLILRRWIEQGAQRN